MKPEHPRELELPSLVEFLNPEIYPQHNEIRWKFLKWILKAENHEIEEIPQKFFTDILILNFLTREGFFTVFEADLILLSIKMAQDGNYERTLEEIPEILDPRAFKVSHLFTKFFQPISKSILLAGLRELSVSLKNIKLI